MSLRMSHCRLQLTQRQRHLAVAPLQLLCMHGANKFPSGQRQTLSLATAHFPAERAVFLRLVSLATCLSRC